MQVANAGASKGISLEQREKEAKNKRKSLLMQRMALRAIFTASVLGSTVVMASTVKDSLSFTEPTLNRNTTDIVQDKPQASRNGIIAFSFLLVGIGCLFHVPEVSKRIRKVERRQQIIASLKQ